MESETALVAINNIYVIFRVSCDALSAANQLRMFGLQPDTVLCRSSTVMGICDRTKLNDLLKLD